MPTPDRMSPRYLTPAQVAELLQIDVSEVQDLVMAGRLEGCQLGSPPRWRVDSASLQAYVEMQTEETRRMALWHQSNEASFPEVWGRKGSSTRL